MKHRKSCKTCTKEFKPEAVRFLYLPGPQDVIDTYLSEIRPPLCQNRYI
jgi:hypothetical protein